MKKQYVQPLVKVFTVKSQILAGSNFLFSGTNTLDQARAKRFRDLEEEEE